MFFFRKERSQDEIDEIKAKMRLREKRGLGVSPKQYPDGTKVDRRSEPEHQGIGQQRPMRFYAGKKLDAEKVLAKRKERLEGKGRKGGFYREKRQEVAEKLKKRLSILSQKTIPHQTSQQRQRERFIQKRDADRLQQQQFLRQRVSLGRSKIRTGFRMKQDMEYRKNQQARQEKSRQFQAEHPRAECLSCHKKTRWQAKHPWRTHCKDCDPVRTVD